MLVWWMMELRYKTNIKIQTTKISKSHRKCQEWKVTTKKPTIFSNSVEDTGRALTFASKSGIICNYIYTRPLPAQNHTQNTQEPREKSEAHLNFIRYNCFQDGRCFIKSPKECPLPADQLKWPWSHWFFFFNATLTKLNTIIS